MMEIDLLKNLNHPNIVKYHGFIKTADTLNIILEYCENGSLAFMCKRFGKFPENLAALYIAQVLEGLAFLHEQGTIHRDIKGANILTTKDGLAKLADFGVATKTNTKLEEKSTVVGTPNWMAPEVIELNGATTASDIWSLGCTVIELLTGHPPYHRLTSMQALFAIVQNNPPIPEGISPVVQDFLMQCFQKDHNFRVTAKKLLKHPWVCNHVQNSKKNRHSTKYDEAVKTVQKWNQAIHQEAAHSQSTNKPPVPRKSHKKTNISKPSLHPDAVQPTPRMGSDPFMSLNGYSKKKRSEFRGMIQQNNILAPSENNSSDWGDDFQQEDFSKKFSLFVDSHKQALPEARPSLSSGDSGVGDKYTPAKITKSKSNAPVLRTPGQQHSMLGMNSPYREHTGDDFSDLIGDLNISKLSESNKSSKSPIPPIYHPSDLTNLYYGKPPLIPKTPSPVHEIPHTPSKQSDIPFSSNQSSPKKTISLNSFQENEEDYDYSNMFKGQKSLTFDHRNKQQERKDVHSNDDDNDSDDPFAEIEEDYRESDIIDNVARERLAYAQTSVETILDNLNKDLQCNYLLESLDELCQTLYEFPETTKTVIKSHGVLLLLDILDLHMEDKVLVPRLLQILFFLLEENNQSLENFCLVGGIPLVAQFTYRKYTNEIRMQAAMFISLLCNSEKYGLPMLLACGGLFILAEFIEEDCDTQPDFVTIGINGIWSVFELQGSAPRNDICRKLSKNNVLESLASVLEHLVKGINNSGEEQFALIDKIVSIFVYFSQTETHVKMTVASRSLFNILFRTFSKLNTRHQLSILKFIKNMSSLPDILLLLQNANAIERLTEILAGTTKTAYFKDYANQILHTMYNMCRLSNDRQEEAAIAGIIPVLQETISADLPLKEFALPILCDMAHSGKACRKKLWQHNGLETYLNLTSDQYWQVKAYEAIATWLQEEFAKVEEHLSEKKSIEQLLKGLEKATGTMFVDGVLEPLQRVMRSSTTICGMLAGKPLFELINKNLEVKRPMLRLNLLRLLRTILEYFPNKFELVKQTGLFRTIKILSEKDETVLVKELTKDLINFSIPKESNYHHSGFPLPQRTPTSDMPETPSAASISRRNSLLQSPPSLRGYNLPSAVPNGRGNMNNANRWNQREYAHPSNSPQMLQTPMSPPRYPSRLGVHKSMSNNSIGIVPTPSSANLRDEFRFNGGNDGSATGMLLEEAYDRGALMMHAGRRSTIQTPNHVSSPTFSGGLTSSAPFSPLCPSPMSSGYTAAEARTPLSTTRSKSDTPDRDALMIYMNNGLRSPIQGDQFK